MSDFPRGSEWNKWDLHIHTPASFFWKGGKRLSEMTADEKDKALAEFVQAINKSDVVAFALMDYWSFDWFIELRSYLIAKKEELKKAVFPGMELRIECSTDYRLNIHVLLSDSLTNQQLIDFKSKLQIRCGSDRKNLSDEALKDCARSLGTDKARVHGFNNPDTLDDNELLQLGSMTAEITRDSLSDAFGQIPIDSGYILLPFDTSDGLLDLDWSKHPHDDNFFMQSAHIFESRDKRNVDLFNGIKTEENKQFFTNFYKTIKNCPKPCISGSDAHSYAEYGKFPSGKCTWIKADPTFEGLKQIVYEPNERVKIQSSTPYADKTKIFFDSMEISGSTHYIIPDTKLPLNRELITLIGGRGSGKSALLDSFAFLNEEHLKKDRNEKKKIVEYYRTNEGKLVPPPSFLMKTSLTDKDGKINVFEKRLSDNTNLELPFLYLGQESLSGVSTNDNELTKTICELVGIDTNEVGQQELIVRARAVLSEVDNTKKQSDDILSKYLSLGYSGDIEIESWIKGYLSKLTDQQKRLSSKETRTILEDINKKTQKGLQLKELKEKSGILVSHLKTNIINDEIIKFNSEILKIYPDNDQLPVFDAKDIIGEVEKIIEKATADMDSLRQSILAQKQALIKQGIKEDVNSLLQASEGLQRQISSIQKDLTNLEQCSRKQKVLYLERKDILDNIQKSTETVNKAITNAYVQFQKSRADSDTEEMELFEKIIEGVSVEGKVDFDSKVFTGHVLENFVDNRKIANETDLKRIIAGESDDGLPKTISFGALMDWIQGDLSNQKYFNRGGLSGITQYIFTQWPEFLRVRAVAKLNDKSTEVLSIGQRGTLLLKVYLATSSAKQVFVIDQPEDNLDNNFIMNELVPLLRRAKKTRQIIISTHNANLVVNTDAEQVIVAQLDQENSYFSGSLENQEIISNVCQILEGGAEAFKKREQKYNIASDKR